MTISVGQVANTNTFDYLRTTVNQLANAMSNNVVTVNSPNTVGNATITGIFTANVLVTANLHFVNSTGYQIIDVDAPSGSAIANTSYYLNANGKWSQLSGVLFNNILTSGTSTQIIDFFLMNTYNAAKYILNVVDNNANNLYSSEILIMHDTQNPYITEYASITTNSNMGVFSASTNTTALILNFTPVSSSTNVKINRILL